MKKMKMKIMYVERVLFIIMYISEREGLCSDDPGDHDSDWTTPAIENLNVKTHLENNINFDIITINTMSETTTAVAVEAKEVASTQGASDTKVRTMINDINVRFVDGRTLYVINLKDSVPNTNGQQDYIWFSPNAIRANLVNAEPDFDIVLDNYSRDNDDNEVLPLTKAQAKAYLVGASVTIGCKFITAGEILTYGDNEYQYEHDAVKYSIEYIELTAKAQRRLDNKIDSLL